MLYMLDTDMCSYIIRKRPISVLETLQKKSELGASICISAITYAELLLGAERSQAREKHLNLISGLVERLDKVLPWDAEAAESFSQLQAYLFSQGTPIGNNDTMIAGHALSVDAMLVTNNQRHFRKVPDIKLENWNSN